MEVDVKAIQYANELRRFTNHKPPSDKPEKVITPEQRVRRDKLEDAKNRMTYKDEGDLL